MRKGLTVLLTVALLVVVIAGTWWAARATMTSVVPDEQNQTAAGQVVWAEAATGSVGRSLPLSTTLRQPAVPVAQNALSGVVTSIAPGPVEHGDVVYVVGDTPVRVVQADAPFWRDLSRGVTGTDVEALQQLLADQGHFTGAVDGDFGAVTERAVTAWQRAEGRPRTGMVPLGELVAVHALPTVVQLGEDIVVGRALAGGEDTVLAPTGEREFVLVVSEDQSRLISAEATVEIFYEDHQWTAVVAGTSQDEWSQITYTLTAPDGGEVCGADCDVLPADAQVTLRSEVVIVPRVEGTTVPASAIRTNADGGAYVTTDAGQVAVTVVGSGQGVAVVESDGITPGVRVQLVDLPGDSQDG